MSKIDVKEARNIAKLARLKLTQGQLKLFCSQLDAILGYIEQLKEVDTKTTPPTNHVLPITNVFRKDEVRPSLPVDEALKNAPERSEDFFKVPKVIEEE